MRANKEDFGFLDDVWLSIVTSAVTALLVNILTGFTFGRVPILQISVSIAACIMIGLHANKKSEGLIAIKTRIELEGLSDNNDPGRRRDIIAKEWGDRRRFLVWTARVTFILIGVSVGLLFYQGYMQRRAGETEIEFRREMVEQFREVRAAMPAKGGHRNAPDSAADLKNK